MCEWGERKRETSEGERCYVCECERIMAKFSGLTEEYSV